MKKSFIYILTFLFLASCVQQGAKKGVVYLDELDEQKTLGAEEKTENANIVENYKKKQQILTQIEAEDKAEQKKLIKKQKDIEAKSAQLEREIEEKIGYKSAEIVNANEKVKELLALNLAVEELEQRLHNETDLSDEDINEVVETYKLQQMIASTQSEEELEKILKERTELKQDEIERIVAIKKQVIEKEQELRKETIRKIHERLVRNRELNIDRVFCEAASKLDQLVLTPVFYPFDVHVIDKGASNQLFNDFDMIADELAKYPDMMLQLEGSCDYKGSNKYNKALGDRRWSGVMPLLTSLGYAQSKIRGISKGEECPVPKLNGESDDSWRAKNRRTDFIWVLK